MARQDVRSPWMDFINSIKYKPNWRFDYQYIIDYDEEVLVIVARVPDRDDPARLVPVNNRQYLPSWRDEKEAQEFIKFAIADLEYHEICENLLFNGVRAFDPHKKEG